MLSKGGLVIQAKQSGLEAAGFYKPPLLPPSPTLLCFHPRL